MGTKMAAQILAVIIFIVMFGLIIWDHIERHIVSLGCGLLTLVLVFGVCMHSEVAAAETLSLRSFMVPNFWFQTEAAAESSSGINWATILFIAGMMLMVEGMERAGFFRWLCLTIAKAVHYKTIPIFISFMLMSAFLAMFIDSITVILFLAAVTEQIGDEWITDLPHLAKLKVYVDDPKFQQEFMNIKYQNKLRLAKYIKEHNGIDVDPRSIFDVQVKRLHEYKRQLLNILHVMYLYNQLKDNPNMDMVPRTFIFGAKAAAGYQIAKKTIKLINSVADVINNDKSINGKLKVVFIEDYRVSNAELIFAAADVSEQISTASKEASGTGNMKFMLNGALTLGTMDGANVEIVEEVGKENAFIFGLSADEVINYENNGGYNPEEIFNTDQDIRRVLMQLINGYYSPQDPELFRDIYNSLLNTKNSAKADTYFILKDFRSYAEAQKRVEAAYRDENWWARAAMLNTASAGKFSSDRTIEEYVRDIWHLEKIHVDDDDVKAL